MLAHLYAELGEAAGARQAFASVFTGELPDLPMNDEWVFGVSLLADVAAFLDDVPRADALYERLVPGGVSI